MKLGFDLDGCLYPWHTYVYQYIRDTYHITDSIEYFWRNFKQYPQEWMDRPLNDAAFYGFGRATPAHVRMVQRLAIEHEIYYISARPQTEAVIQTTAQWLTNNGFPCVNNLFICKEKQGLIQQLGIEMFLEDRMDIIEKIAALTYVVMVKQVWNEPYWGQFPTIDDAAKFETQVNNIYQGLGCLTLPVTI